MTWKRPYRDPYRALTGVSTAFVAVGFLAAVSAFAGILVVSFFVKDHPPIPWSMLRVVAGIALLASINRFRFGVDAMVGDRLWIDLVDGRSIRTPVQRVRRANDVRYDGGTRQLPDAADDLLRNLDQELRARRAMA